MYIYLHYIDSIFNKTKPILRTVKIISDIIFMTFKLICVFYIIVLFNSAFVVFLFFSFFFFILHKHVQVIFNFQIKR